jgi:hypothetical protein
MPCPEIKVTTFKIENLRQDPKQESAYICDVTVAGSVTSVQCDVIPTAQCIVDEVRFYAHDDDKPIGAFAVTGSKSTNGSRARPFPFDGTFRFTATGITVMEGNNTFRIVARDKVLGVDGFSSWAASFAFPYDDDPDDCENPSVKDPTVVEGPQFLGGGSGGEMTLYCVALADQTTAGEWALITDTETGGACEFKGLPDHNATIAVWPGTTSPAFFTVRPTRQMNLKAPTDGKMVSALTSNPGISSLSPRERFIYGFTQGLGFEGYDLVFDCDKVISCGARLTENLEGMLIEAEVADAVGNRCQGHAVVRFFTEGPSFAANMPSATPNLLWRFADLFRTSNPLANEMVISLIVGDLSDVGLKGVSIADWREYFYMCIAELLEELIKETSEDSELAQGYYLGRGIADALRIALNPKGADRLEELGKAEFLTRLKRMPFFSSMGRGGLVLSMFDDYVERLNQFVGRRGK